jgi:DNA-binding response OmpR family regulator
MDSNEHQKESSQTTSPLRLLIADDDPPTRILLRAAISQWGYETVEASNGEEAWEILQLPNPPPLLIVDWLMPKLDGTDLCKRIRSELVNSNMTYIILLTQMTGSENIIKGLEAGANEFLSKPFNMAELRSRLSVGRRIIQYALALEDLNIQFKKINDLAILSSNQLNELSTEVKKNGPEHTKIQDIISELDKLINICKKSTIISDKKI